MYYLLAVFKNDLVSLGRCSLIIFLLLLGGGCVLLVYTLFQAAQMFAF